MSIPISHLMVFDYDPLTGQAIPVPVGPISVGKDTLRDPRYHFCAAITGATPAVIAVRRYGPIEARKSHPMFEGGSTVTSLKPRLLIFIVAYFAETTIKKVVNRIPATLADIYDVEILIIDDSSKDETFAESVGAGNHADNPFKVTVLHNPVNQGYGGNQKIGYHYAIEHGFDLVALLHGDGQYAPEALGALIAPVREREADAVFGSRMMIPGAALKGGMPLYKYFGNRILTFMQNRLLGTLYPNSTAGSVYIRWLHSGIFHSTGIRTYSTLIQS